MASSPYETLSNIRLAVIKDAKESTSTSMVSLVDRWINEGHEQVTLRKKRDWLDEQFTVQVSAAVSASCSVTNGSTTVTFTGGTTFPSSVELGFYVQGFQEIYNVSSATLNVVTLSNAFLGTTNTAATGVVFQKSILIDDDIRTVYQLYHGFEDSTVTDVGPQQMRSIQESGGPQLGYARYFTLFGQNNSTGARRVLLYPYPDEAYTIYIDANTFVPVLTAATDEPVIPMQYRQILYWYGLYKLWLYHRNETQAANAFNSFKEMLRQIDGEMRSEIEFPQITVAYPKARTFRSFRRPFNPLMRDDS